MTRVQTGPVINQDAPALYLKSFDKSLFIINTKLFEMGKLSFLDVGHFSKNQPPISTNKPSIQKIKIIKSALS